MRRILKNLFVILSIIILLYVFYSKYIRNDKIVKIFGYSFFIVLTGSMEPEIDTGSLVIIKDYVDYNLR